MTDSGYENLANGIIVQACKDYRDALKKLKRNPKHRESLFVKKDVEEFFRSDWFDVLTTLDGEMVIKKIREEIKYDG